MGFYSTVFRRKNNSKQFSNFLTILFRLSTQPIRRSMRGSVPTVAQVSQKHIRKGIGKINDQQLHIWTGLHFSGDHQVCMKQYVIAIITKTV